MALSCQPTYLAGKPSISSIPPEIARMVVNNLPYEDLFNARFVNKTFAFVTAEPLFCSIPLWINIKSLKAITELSQATHLRDHVKHLVFSTLSFIEHEDRDAYFAKVKTALEIHTDSSSISALQLGQHMTAYHASIEAQRYLTRENLDLKILARAFKKFSNLQRITFDHHNSRIGARQLLSEFGTLYAADLLTCDGKHTFSILLRAISESGTKVLGIKIGHDSRYTLHPGPRLFGYMSQGGPDFPESLDASAINGAIRVDSWYHTQKVMHQLQSLEIDEIGIEDRPELLRMAAAIKRLISLAFELQRLKIHAIGVFNCVDHMQPLSIEELLEPRGFHRLRFLTLDHLEISNHQHIVSFLSQHAPTLSETVLICIELINAKWSAVLDQLKASRWPYLTLFSLEFCEDPESKTLSRKDRVHLSWVHDYILHKSNRNPRVLPYEK